METEDPEPRPQALATGELVWAKTKGRHPRASAPPPQNPPSSPPPAAAVKPFLAVPDADALARANTGLAFVPHEFLAALGSAAVDAPAISLLDRARLDSWVRVEPGPGARPGMGPDGPSRYQRRTKDELINKIGLDMLADDGAASEEEEEKKERVRRVRFWSRDAMGKMLALFLTSRKSHYIYEPEELESWVDI